MQLGKLQAKTSKKTSKEQSKPNKTKTIQRVNFLYKVEGNPDYIMVAINLSELFFEKLDKTFNMLFIVVNVIIVPFVTFSVFSSPDVARALLATFLFSYYFVPLILLVLLWWGATFLDKLSLRIVCWYGLFYLVAHGLWIMMSNYVFIAYKVNLLEFALLWYYLGMPVIFYWTLCVYLGPLAPTLLSYRRYSHAQKPSLKRVCVGISIFIVITMVFAIIGFLGCARRLHFP